MLWMVSGLNRQLGNLHQVLIASFIQVKVGQSRWQPQIGFKSK